MLPFSLAKAAARLYQDADELLIGDPERVAKLINKIDDTRLSTVRGVFRTATPINPKGLPLQFVRTNANGVGAAGWVMAHSPGADEATAAGEFARAIDLPGAATFAALSFALDLSLYWLGLVPITMQALACPSKKSELAMAVAKHRPAKRLIDTASCA